MNDPVEELLRRKLESLRESAELAKKMYEAGEANVTVVHEANSVYLDALLALKKTKPERLVVLTDLVQEAEKLVQAMELLFQAKELGQRDVIRAQVTLLDRRIALLREA